MDLHFSFLAAFFLAPMFAVVGGALVAIPILIHILNRRRYKTVTWAAMEFLLKAMRKNRRRLRFEQWLLLATRCLVLLLLGLALSRPTGCSDSSLAGLAGERNSLHVFVIDNSYSMAYQANRPDAKTHLDQAKKLAKQLVAKLSAGGESVAVVLASRPAEAVLVKPSYDLAAVGSAIDRIDQSFNSTDLHGALAAALTIGKDEARAIPKYLTIFSDATRSAWETPQADALSQLGTELAKVFRVRHYSLAMSGQWNQAVLDAKPASALVTTRFGSDLLATARGYGVNPPVPVVWKLDEAQLPGTATVQLDPQTPALVQSQAPLRIGGTHLLAVNLAGDDRLPIDNIRYRSIDVASELKLLIVEGERASGALGSSGAFLQLALAPPKDGSGKSDSYVVPELISDLELSSKPLADYRTIVLCGVGQISTQVADALQRFVQQGGTLLMFMGESVNADNYNQVLLPRKLMAGRLVRRMNAPADGKGYTFDFNPKGVIHPLLSIFRGEEKSGLDTAQIFTYWQMELTGDSHAERVLDYVKDPGDEKSTRGNPAITVHSFGQGKVLFFSTTANAEWTSFPAKPAYVSLMHELVGGTVGTSDEWMNRTVGQSVQLPSTLKLTATPTLTDSNQNTLALIMRTVDGQSVYQSDVFTKPGVYMLSTGMGRVPISVNVPSDEADVRTLDNTAIKRALGEIEIDLQGDQLPPDAAVADEGRDFGWNIMLIVLAMIGFESFLAMRFGHHTRTK